MFDGIPDDEVVDAFCSACESGDLETVRCAVRKSPSMESAYDLDHASAFCYVVDELQGRQWATAVLQILLEESTVDPSFPCSAPPLSLAVQNGNLEMCRLFLRDHRVDVNDQDPFLTAVKNNDLEIVDAFLTLRRDQLNLNAVTEDDSQTALSLAVANKSQDMVELLCGIWPRRAEAAVERATRVRRVRHRKASANRPTKCWTSSVTCGCRSCVTFSASLRRRRRRSRKSRRSRRRRRRSRRLLSSCDRPTASRNGSWTR